MLKKIFFFLLFLTLLSPLFADKVLMWKPLFKGNFQREDKKSLTIKFEKVFKKHLNYINYRHIGSKARRYARCGANARCWGKEAKNTDFSYVILALFRKTDMDEIHVRMMMINILTKEVVGDIKKKYFNISDISNKVIRTHIKKIMGKNYKFVKKNSTRQIEKNKKTKEPQKDYEQEEESYENLDEKSLTAACDSGDKKACEYMNLQIKEQVLNGKRLPPIIEAIAEYGGKNSASIYKKACRFIQQCHGNVLVVKDGFSDVNPYSLKNKCYIFYGNMFQLINSTGALINISTLISESSFNKEAVPGGIEEAEQSMRAYQRFLNSDQTLAHVKTKRGNLPMKSSFLVFAKGTTPFRYTNEKNAHKTINSFIIFNFYKISKDIELEYLMTDFHLNLLIEKGKKK